MRTEDCNRAIWYFMKFFNKYRAFVTQALYYEFIMYYFMTHIDRRTKNFEHALDNLDSTLHTRAKSSGIS